MRAINCTQCGATIENVSERSVIVDCEYCGARMFMDRLANLPTPEPPQVPAPSFELEAEPDPGLTFVWVVGAALASIPLLFVVFLFIKPATKPNPSYVYSAPASPVPYTAPSYWNTPAEPAKPVPVVNYQPRVSWDGPNDLDHFEDPEVDVSSVSELSSEEIKKTVFKNRVVKLRVVINTEGEVDTVETISGHTLLVEAATQSAKRSIFRNRSKPTTRILTYTFRLLPD